MAKEYQYTRVYNYFRDRIKKELLKPGDIIPPEPEIENMFNVSRTTVRKAISLLVEEGYLDVKQGRGTMVLDNKAMHSLNHVTSVYETLKHKGYSVETREIYVDTFKANSFIAEHLGVNLGEKVIRIQRIQVANGEPLAIVKNYINMKFVPDIINKKDQIVSLYTFLEEEYGIKIDSATEIISAKNASFEEAQMLSIPVGKALIVLRRTCYMDSTPVCVDYSKLVGSKYELEINIYGREKYSSDHQ